MDRLLSALSGTQKKKTSGYLRHASFQAIRLQQTFAVCSVGGDVTPNLAQRPNWFTACFGGNLPAAGSGPASAAISLPLNQDIGYARLICEGEEMCMCKLDAHEE
jgi:hypothetical protein